MIDREAALGDALFQLSAHLRGSGFLAHPMHHDAWERVVEAFNLPIPLVWEEDMAKVPTDEMFVWGEPKQRGLKFGWGLGLAYRNVSGGWSDAYGAPVRNAKIWCRLPEPPNAVNKRRRLR